MCKFKHLISDGLTAHSKYIAFVHQMYRFIQIRTCNILSCHKYSVIKWYIRYTFNEHSKYKLYIRCTIFGICDEQKNGTSLVCNVGTTMDH